MSALAGTTLLVEGVDEQESSTQGRDEEHRCSSQQPRPAVMGERSCGAKRRVSPPVPPRGKGVGENGEAGAEESGDDGASTQLRRITGAPALNFEEPVVSVSRWSA